MFSTRLPVRSIYCVRKHSKFTFICRTHSLILYPKNRGTKRVYILIQAAKMGHEFGNLAKLKGVTTYSLSPYEQRAFAGYFSKGFPKMLSLLAHRVQYIAPFFFTYFLIDWSRKQYERNIRKDPKIYAEVDKEFE